jgi:hypothetical protein
VATFTALYDACILYPVPVRDLFMHLAMTDLFRAKWTNAIHDEWIENLLEDRKVLTRQQLERTRDLMNAHVRDCLVTGYEPLIPSLTLPDEDDRHVLAAAIAGRADVIVTYNLKDFPPDVLEGFGIEAQHPDDFVNHLLDLAPAVVCTAVKQQRESLKRRPVSAEQLLATLESLALPQTVAQLRQFIRLL